MEKVTYACLNLCGKKIHDWEVLSQLNLEEPDSEAPLKDSAVYYNVTNGDVKACMKVFNYEYANNCSLLFGQTRMEYLRDATTAFSYESALAQFCNSRHASNVIIYLDAGEVNLDGFSNTTVSYIVYETIEANVYQLLDFSRLAEIAANMKVLSDKLKSLHDITKGLNQLHSNSISHQSVTPVNVVSTSSGMKIANLSTALCFDTQVKCPFDLIRFNGDWTYAPPEAFFAHQQKTEKDTMFQMDNYMLGGLIVYYLTGLSLNAIVDQFLGANTMDEMSKQGRTFESILPDLVNAYDKAINMIGGIIPNEEIRSDLIEIITALTYPDPAKRGDKRTLALVTPNYDLQRTITKLDVLEKKSRLISLKIYGNLH